MLKTLVERSRQYSLNGCRKFQKRNRNYESMDILEIKVNHRDEKFLNSFDRQTQLSTNPHPKKNQSTRR